MRRAFIACALLIASGCDNAAPCPPVLGCNSSDYELVRAWSAGEYEVEVAYALGGDVAFVCTLSHPGSVEDDDGGGTGNTSGECTQMEGDPRGVLLNILRDGTAVLLSVYDSPDAFDLTLRRDGETLFESTITPDYETTHLAGRTECGTCRRTEMRIELQ